MSEETEWLLGERSRPPEPWEIEENYDD